MRGAVLVLAIAALVPGVAAAAAPAPPWVRGDAIGSDQGDARVVTRQWRVADNRTGCAPLTIRSTGAAGRGARARGAYFGGGWGVAWDLPGHRSAFGVAGAGVVARGADIARWPSRLSWSDGSAAGYGLVGGTGPGHLAYVRRRGETCLYNVWSDLGVAHLRLLISQLRAVRVAAG